MDSIRTQAESTSLKCVGGQEGTRFLPCHCELAWSDHSPAQTLNPSLPGLETQASSLTPFSAHPPPIPSPAILSPNLSISLQHHCHHSIPSHPLLGCCYRLLPGFPVSSLTPATTKIIPIKHKSYLVAPLLTALQKPLNVPGRISKILTWVDSVLAIYSSLLASSPDLPAF